MKLYEVQATFRVVQTLQRAITVRAEDEDAALEAGAEYYNHNQHDIDLYCDTEDVDWDVDWCGDEPTVVVDAQGMKRLGGPKGTLLDVDLKEKS